MKIKNALDDCKTTYIKISSEKGSGWWYAGKLEDFDLSACNMALLDYNRERMETALNNVRTTALGIKNIGAWAWSEMKKESGDGTVTYKGYLEYIDQTLRHISQMWENYLERKEQYENFQQLRQRDVIDVFPADPAVDRDCTCIVVSGVESGAYWALDEADGDTPLGFYK